MTALTAGSSCLARRPGLHSRKESAKIVEALPKGYRVAFADGAVLKVPRVWPLQAERKTSLRSKQQRPVQQREAIDRRIDFWNSDPSRPQIVRASTMPAPAAPQPKPEAPERCPEWLAMVRKLPCCNCGARPPVDPHHEGPRGVGQKCRDTRTAPLCRRCHDVYTDTNLLPRAVEFGGGLFSRNASLSILHGAMLRIYERVLRSMETEQHVEVLSAALARMDKTQLLRALRSA